MLQYSVSAKSSAPRCRQMIPACPADPFHPAVLTAASAAKLKAEYKPSLKNIHIFLTLEQPLCKLSSFKSSSSSREPTQASRLPINFRYVSHVYQ